jgi:hypothetical protein
MDGVMSKRYCSSAPVIRTVVLTFILATCLRIAPALAVNLGDVPANEALSSTCPKVSFLGPKVTAECADRSQLIIKSEIDVRRCAGYALAVDSAGRLRCKGRARH